jgi:hypothetical protein
MRLTFKTLCALSVQARIGAAVFAPANRMFSLTSTSPSELSVYESSFLPVIGLREVTLIFEPPPRRGEWREM